MKYMKLGTKPDTFYTEEAVRSVVSDVPADLIIHVNNTKYLLHKFPLLLKCGLLQQLCSSDDGDGDESSPVPVALHDIPGGEEAFEACAKFCYGISISICASTLVPALLAARFLRMTEAAARGNLVAKLESFFDACVLAGWKDSVAALQAAWRLSGWAESRLVHPCLDSIVDKILTPPGKVTWSFTYTRPGYNGNNTTTTSSRNRTKPRQSVPRDWWTEDVSELDVEVFRSVLSTARASGLLPPPLVGEALHVYACKHLPDPLRAAAGNGGSSSAAAGGGEEEAVARQRRVLETIVTMIPGEAGAVTGRFLLRLLRTASRVGASPSARAQLVRQAGAQLDEAAATDLLVPLPPPSESGGYDVGAAEAVLEHFLAQFRRPGGAAAAPEERRRMSAAMGKVARTFDEYLRTIAELDRELPVGRFVDLVECLPDIARTDHDGLYRAIDVYLKEHPELSKADKKRLCRLIDCRKLSPDVRAQAISNDRMPLRTIVQLLFVEQERTMGGTASHGAPPADRAASADAISSRLATKEEEPASSAAAGHKSDVHRPRRDHARVADGAAAAAMTRSLSAKTPAPGRMERTPEERGSRMRNNKQ
ncbi:unnamed protein product [Urochloa humidicola]